MGLVIECIPMSTNYDKIRFFGTLMPALLLLKASPPCFLNYQIEGCFKPRTSVEEWIASQADDAGQFGDTLVFVHRWHSLRFDPFTFAHAKTYLRRLVRLLNSLGFTAQPLDPLSPDVNLPKLGASAGLGNLSPYGLLVHPAFGPRVILTGLKTNYPIQLKPHWCGGGCNDCLACVKLCPQEPILGGKVDLGHCQSCAKCLEVCPTGKGKAHRKMLELNG